jgi:hypothetical protein
MEKKFNRESYPFDILEKFGLTEGMLLDLPDYVHDIIERGGKSPLLPLTVSQPDGKTVRCYAKFALVDFDGEPEVMFYPKFKQADLAPFDELQREALLEGKVIVADVMDRFVTDEGVEDEQRIKAFVQLDQDTNTVVYTPTPTIARNISALSDVYGLDGDEIRRFWDGDLVMTRVRNDEGVEETVTIGVDLNTETGVLAVPGIAEQWIMAVRRRMPEYSFGMEGCWVNRDGRLRYVHEEDFTSDIIEAQQESSRQQELLLHAKGRMHSGDEYEEPMGNHVNPADEYGYDASRGMGY